MGTREENGGWWRRSDDREVVLHKMSDGSSLVENDGLLLSG